MNSKKTILCPITLFIRLTCVLTAIAMVTPALAEMRESHIKESQVKTDQMKSQVSKVMIGYVGRKGSIEKAAQDLIK
jgi:hypothetical protein